LASLPLSLSLSLLDDFAGDLIDACMVPILTQAALDALFVKQVKPFDAVIHFAGLKVSRKPIPL
jgi:hypothetical protein